MVQHARRPIQTDDHAHDQEGRRDDAQCVAVGEPDGQDGGCKLPCRGVEGVGEPVCDQSVNAPFAVTEADRVEVCVV